MTVARERAILVEVLTPEQPRGKDYEPLGELIRLTESAGGMVVGTITQKRSSIDSGLYIGRGKAEEIGRMAASRNADVIIFDNDLTPGQIRNLEKIIDRKVLDRSELILDIFATRARTHEARLQVELAQLEYTLPRLRRMWGHLSRMKAAIGTRGPGETQLETDRRLVRRRISDLRSRIAEIERRRERQVQGRKNEFSVSLVGYTNAGKSSLLNRLTGDEAYVADQLFATLDTRTRAWMLPHNLRVLLSDTVGFVRDLPHHLVASFRATLEEARHADLLLHVVDAGEPDLDGQIEAVNVVLEEIGCHGNPVLLVFNKIDVVPNEAMRTLLEFRYPDAVFVSAHSGEAIDKLQQRVQELLAGPVLGVSLCGPAGEGDWQAAVARHAEQMEHNFVDTETCVRTRLPQHLVDYLLQEYPQVKVTVEEGAGRATDIKTRRVQSNASQTAGKPRPEDDFSAEEPDALH